MTRKDFAALVHCQRRREAAFGHCGSRSWRLTTRHLRDRKAVARYAGLTGSPDESGKRRRERGLARAGNARVRRGMIQLAWCFIKFQRIVPWQNGLMRERPTDAAVRVRR